MGSPEWYTQYRVRAMDGADVALLAFLVCLTVGGLLAEFREALGPPPVRWTRSWVRFLWRAVVTR